MYPLFDFCKQNSSHHALYIEYIILINFIVYTALRIQLQATHPVNMLPYLALTHVEFRFLIRLSQTYWLSQHSTHSQVSGLDGMMQSDKVTCSLAKICDGLEHECM